MDVYQETGYPKLDSFVACRNSSPVCVVTYKEPEPSFCTYRTKATNGGTANHFFQRMVLRMNSYAFDGKDTPYTYMCYRNRQMTWNDVQLLSVVFLHGAMQARRPRRRPNRQKCAIHC